MPRELRQIDASFRMACANRARRREPLQRKNMPRPNEIRRPRVRIIKTLTVSQRSAAEIPVVTLCRASTER